MNATIRAKSGQLSIFLLRAFLKIGLPREQAQSVVKLLITTSLRGVDTHGIVLAERYIEGIRERKINVKPKIKLVRDGPSTALMDGDAGLGAYLATRATELAIRKARRAGVGSVSLINLTHCGALSYYGLMVGKAKMAGLVFTNASRLAAPWGGATPIFGTNPLCYCFPNGSEPIALDIATTTAAGQKVVFAARDGKEIPLGWALDSNGRPTTDPKEAMKGSFLPFGGYKGYGLMLMVELYSSIMAGGGPSYEGEGRYYQGGFYVQAFRIESIIRYAKYRRDVNKLVRRIRASKLAEGHERVYLPGEIELITCQKRKRQGIPVDPQTWNYFMELSKQFDIPLPERVIEKTEQIGDTGSLIP